MRHIHDFVHGKLGAVDVSRWHNIPPEQFTDRPELLEQDASHDAAARALKYARCAGSLSYDEIGYRSLAVTPTKGYVPLQSFAQARADARRQDRRRLPPLLETLLEQQPKLRHRPLSLPDGHLQFTINDQLVNLVRKPVSDEPSDGIVWSFPLGAPPSWVLDSAEDRDLPLLMTQHELGNLPRMDWLPLLTLIGSGRFERYQEWSNSLVTGVLPGTFYCFLSHRWLTPTAPDPDGVQARLTAWQFFSAMCEAVYVAHERGVHTPRKHSELFSNAVGVAGSELAESLLVNVVRKALDPPALTAVREEILSLQEITADNGVQAAHSDAGLARLRGLVAGHPLLGGLLSRVCLWYDYSCLPQKPRTPEEQAQFEHGMQQFGLLQALGRTAVLLDDADDYLSRAWCTLEVLTADLMQNFDVLVGADRPTLVKGRTEHHLRLLLEDRPHVVWRAVLDTEVFRVQSPAECLLRLELGVTDAADLPVIYMGLCALGAPRKVHVDESEVVTGTFPLPVLDHGRTVVVPSTTSRRVSQPGPTKTATLNWMGAFGLEGLRPPEPLATGSHVVLGRSRWQNTCHVAVVGSCEGEAVLISNWIRARTQELKRAVGASPESLTWLATDIAPVGHFVEGALRTAPVDASLWVLVASSVRFERCAVVQALINTLLAAHLPFVTLAIDSPGANVKHFAAADGGARGDVPDTAAVRLPAARVLTAEWRGGLFRDQLLQELVTVTGADR